MMQRGLLDAEQEDPFTLFVASTNIRYCYYAETHTILGNTFGMCVLQVRWCCHVNTIVAAIAY
jgi:N-acetyltransferase 10